MSVFNIEPENRPRNDTLGMHAVRMHYDDDVVHALGLERGNLIRLKTSEGCVYRIFVGGSNIKKNRLRMDYETGRKLGLIKAKKQHQSASIDIEKCRFFWQNWAFHWHHPENGVRVGSRAAVWLTFWGIVLSKALDATWPLIVSHVAKAIEVLNTLPLS